MQQIDLFFINVHNLIEMKAALVKNFHIPPSEIDKMPFWEYEIFMLALNDQVKEENEKQQAEMDKYGVKDIMKNSNPKNLQKNASGMMPKAPSFGSMKAPTFKF